MSSVFLRRLEVSEWLFFQSFWKYFFCQKFSKKFFCWTNFSETSKRRRNMLYSLNKMKICIEKNRIEDAFCWCEKKNQNLLELKKKYLLLLPFVKFVTKAIIVWVPLAKHTYQRSRKTISLNIFFFGVELFQGFIPNI